MSASAEIHAQLASILERFAKRALLEMSRAVEQEMTRRQMEVETLLLKLQFTESELRSARQNQQNLRSVGTQASSSSSAQREVKLNFVKINENHDGESQTETHTGDSSAQTFTLNEDGIKSVQIKEEHMEDGQWDSGPISPALCRLEDQDSFSTGSTGAAAAGSDFLLTSKMKSSGMWNSPVSEEYPVNSGAQSLEASPLETGVTAYSAEAQADHHSQEKIVVRNPSEEKPQCSAAVKREESVTRLKEREEEELSGLEFEMKIERVEELVDQTLSRVQAEQKREGQNHCHDGNSRLWCSGKAFDHPGSLMESDQHPQDFTDSYVMEDPTVESTRSGLLADLENESFGAAGVEYCMNPLDSLRRSPRTSASDSTAFNTLPSSYSSLSLPKTLTQSTGKHAGEKPFRCQLCGRGFSQRTRLLTHRLVHTGEKPFRCEECGKGFTQRKRLLTHRLVHTGEKPFRCQLCGKTFSRQDNCLRHVRLHSGPR